MGSPKKCTTQSPGKILPQSNSDNAEDDQDPKPSATQRGPTENLAEEKSAMAIPELATRYRVAERTIKRWRVKGAPLHDADAMVIWARDQTNLPAGFVEWLEERGSTPQATNASDWSAFLEQSKRDAADAPKEAMAKVTAARDLASFRFMEAAKVKNRVDMKLYADLLAKFDGVLHDSQLRAKKLGMDEGQLLPRAEVERILYAVAYWLLRLTDQNLDAVCLRIAKMAPGLEAEVVRKVLEPELLSDRMLVPFARAAKIQGGPGLPDWVPAKMRTALGDFLSKGEEQFDAIAPEAMP